MSLPAWGDADNAANNRSINRSRMQYREQVPAETYQSGIYTEISNKPLHRDRSGDSRGEYKDPLNYGNKEGVDMEIKAAQAATAAYVQQQEQQQHDFDELNCRQWMHNMAEKVSTLASCTNKIQHQMIKSGDLDKDVRNVIILGVVYFITLHYI